MAQGKTLESFCPSSLQSISASTPESLHYSPQPHMDSLIAGVEAWSRVKVKTSLPLVQKLHASRIDHYLELRNRCLAGPAHRPEVIFWLDKMISALNRTCCKAVGQTNRYLQTRTAHIHRERLVSCSRIRVQSSSQPRMAAKCYADQCQSSKPTKHSPAWKSLCKARRRKCRVGIACSRTVQQNERVSVSFLVTVFLYLSFVSLRLQLSLECHSGSLRL